MEHHPALPRAILTTALKPITSTPNRFFFPSQFPAWSHLLFALQTPHIGTKMHTFECINLSTGSRIKFPPDKISVCHPPGAHLPHDLFYPGLICLVTSGRSSRAGSCVFPAGLLQGETSLAAPIRQENACPCAGRSSCPSPSSFRAEGGREA